MKSANKALLILSSLALIACGQSGGSSLIPVSSPTGSSSSSASSASSVSSVSSESISVPTVERTVRFLNEGVDFVDPVTVEDGKTVSAPAETPTKDPSSSTVYVFDAWTLDGVSYDFSSPVTKDLTLEAHYQETPRNYLVTFDYEDSSITNVVYNLEYGAAIPTPVDPESYEADGYHWDFREWVDEEENAFVPGETTVTRDVTYTPYFHEGEPIIYSATVSYEYDDSIEDVEIEYDIENRDEKRLEILALLPEGPEGEYSFATPIPDELPLEDGNYVIQSAHAFKNDYSLAGLNENHLITNCASRCLVEAGLLHYTVNAKSDSSLATVAEDYDCFTLEFEVKSSLDRTGVYLAGAEFDTSATWIRASKNCSGGTTVSQYAVGGAVFHAGDFNTYKYVVYNNSNGARRIKFYLNGTNVLANDAAFAMTEPTSGKIEWTVCPVSGVSPEYHFRSISITL